MASLPNLSALRPALARTGPYVDVFGDDHECPLVYRDFDGGHTMALRSGRVYRSRQCDKAWQLIVRDANYAPKLEKAYYDTIHLGIAIAGGLARSPLTNEPIDPTDAQMCVQKAEELVRALGKASLAAYKQERYPSSAVPAPAPLNLDAERGRGLAFQGLVADFSAAGERAHDAVILQPVIGGSEPNPWHYSNILKLANGRGEFRQLSDAQVGELRNGLLLNGFNAEWPLHESSRLAALLWAAHEEYKSALDILAWNESVDQNGRPLKEPGQRWENYWEYFQNDDVAERILEIRHSEPPLTLGDLGGYAAVAASQLRSFPANRPAFAITELPTLQQWSWTPTLLVARATLTLWAAIQVATGLRVAHPGVMGLRPIADVAEALSEIETLPLEYATAALADERLRIPRQSIFGAG